MVGRDQLAEAEHRRALIDRADVARDPKGSQRALVVLALDDDGRVSVLLAEILEDPLQVVVELLPFHRLTYRTGGGRQGLRAGSHHISAAGYANCAGRGRGECRTR